MPFKSKRSNEGELFIDAGPIGVPDNLIIPGVVACPIVKPNRIEEFPTYCCKHCNATVVMNPLRTRDRAYCPGCDHYICDNCEGVRKIQGCKTLDEIFDKMIERHYQNLNIGEL